KTLREVLLSDFEITTATPRFLEQWAALGNFAKLKELTSTTAQEERRHYLLSHHMSDIMREFPIAGLAPEEFLKGLRTMQPRLYSIASSSSGFPDEAHLTVSTVQYELHGSRRTGLASGYFAREAGLGSLLPVYIEPNPNFRLAPDDVPIIMIGAG